MDATAWLWVLVNLVTRLYLQFGPFDKVEYEFRLKDQVRVEAREFSNARNCRNVLCSVPIVAAVAVLATAEKLNPCDKSLFAGSLVAVIAILLLVAAIKIPAKHFRGQFPPIIVQGSALIFDILSQVFIVKYAAHLICSA